MFIEEQESFIRDIPSREAPMLPLITGNLHDSIGAVTSLRGRVVRASYTTPIAKTTSELSKKEIYKSTSGMGRKRIIGSLEAFNMVKSLQGKYPHGIAITMFVAVPYALNPNERGRHIGYLDQLRLFFAGAMAYIFRRAEAKKLFELKGVNLDTYIQITNRDDDPMVREYFASKGPKKRGPKKGSNYMGSAKPGMGMKIY